MTTDPFDPLDTMRLRLRCPRLSDVTGLTALVTPAITRWMASWTFPLTASLAEDRIKSAQTAAVARRAMCCIIEAERVLAGWIEIGQSETDPGTGALSYWIGEAHQGRGYAREAASSLMPKAFAFLRLNTIEAGTQPENFGSLGVMRALGMRYVGERSVFATARERNEMCSYFALDRGQPISVAESQ